MTAEAFQIRWGCSAFESFTRTCLCVTLASVLACGLAGNWTSVALRMVFSWRISCWDWLWPNGWGGKTNNKNICKPMSFTPSLPRHLHLHMFLRTELSSPHAVQIDTQCRVPLLYLASIETLEEDHSHRPNVHLIGDFRWLLSHHKTLWREVPETEPLSSNSRLLITSYKCNYHSSDTGELVKQCVLTPHCILPVGACSLWREVHSIHAIVIVVHYLGQAKVGDFDFSTCSTIHQ